MPEKLHLRQISLPLGGKKIKKINTEYFFLHVTPGKSQSIFLDAADTLKIMLCN